MGRFGKLGLGLGRNRDFPSLSSAMGPHTATLPARRVRMTGVSKVASNRRRVHDDRFDPGPISGRQKQRFRLVFLVVLGCFAGVMGRLFHLQCLCRESLALEAEKQRSIRITIPSRRGDVLDRQRHKLASTVDVQSLHAFPDKILEPRKTAETLAPMLGRTSRDVFELLTSDSHFVWVQRKIEPEIAQRIAGLNIVGLGFTPETKRSYPKGMLASHVLGFVGVDGQGLEGLELQYDSVLRGVDGWCFVERDAHQRPLLPLTTKMQEPSGGNTVVLTIDEVIQHIVEKALDRAYIASDADAAVCVVQDPSTGEILALACRPAFDPNRYWAYPVGNRRNRAVTDGYEPGSCLKVVPTTALLQERLIEPSELIYCEQGAMRLHGRIMHDFRPHGTLTFAEVISESSNIGTIKAAMRLSEQQLYEYCKLFGFGQKTGLDFPGECHGLLRPPSKWSGLSLASIAIGQEIAVSPVQLVRAFSAIANDGIMMQPLLVRQVEQNDGTVVERFEPKQQWRVMSRATAEKLKRLLRKVVDDGSGHYASVEGYEVGGKTGTAQKVDPSTGLYYSDRHVAIFCGFVPVDKPRLSILVLVDSPRVEPDTGGAVAAPVFREIAEASLNYLRVPPDRPETLYVKDDTSVAELDGRRTQAVVEAAARFEAMPDLTGMSKLEVIQALSSLQLELAFEGSGYVVAQSIEPGQMVNPGAECKITFAKDGMPHETLRFTRAGGSEPR